MIAVHWLSISWVDNSVFRSLITSNVINSSKYTYLANKLYRSQAVFKLKQHNKRLDQPSQTLTEMAWLYYLKGRNNNILLLINRFPSKDGGLRDAWTKAVSRQDANSSTLWQPGTGSALCCDHFLLTDFQVRPGAAKRLLKDTAVPSVFPSYPKYMQVKT